MRYVSKKVMNISHVVESKDIRILIVPLRKYSWCLNLKSDRYKTKQTAIVENY